MLDRLGHAMTALRQVSTDLAHDLRTPLSRLRNTLEEGAGGDDHQRAEWAARGIADIDEVLDVLNALLRIAQVESSNRKSAFGPLDIGGLVTTIADAYRPAAEESGHAIAVAAPSGIEVNGDVALLKQLLANLVDNALRHTPAGSRIDIAVTAGRENATVSVADDGPGVPRADIGNITRRFYRLDRSRSTPGAGLGLTLAKAIADLHGAPFTLSDNRPGLRIEIALTRSPAPADQQAGAPPAT